MLQPAGPKRRQEDRHALARVAAWTLRWQPLLLLAIGLFTALGFKQVWPSEQIADLSVRVRALEKASEETQRTLRVLADAKCVELTPEQLALAQIDCSRVFGRLRPRE